MTRKPKSAVVQVFNDVLTAELTAINQYFMHAELCEHWGFAKLHEAARKSSTDEMRHAERLIERILDIGGFPNLQKLGQVNIGDNVPEQFRADLTLEHDAVVRLREGIAACQADHDYISARLLEEILAAEEEHIRWLETQQYLLEKVGEQNYLARMM